MVSSATVPEAKAHMRIDLADDDGLITALIATARDKAERFTRRAFITQVYDLVRDNAPGELEIPRPALQSIGGVFVTSDDGVESQVSATLYNPDTKSTPGRVRLKSGETWPSHRGFASFRVRFTAGYGDQANAVPEAIKTVIKIIVADLYENREGRSEATFAPQAEAGIDIPDLAKTLLQPYRVPRI